MISPSFKKRNPAHCVLPVAIATTLTMLSTGCVRTPAVAKSDVNDAEEVITRSFGQWKSGRTPDDLRNAQPPIYVADDFWLRGYQLTDFSMEKPGELYGTNVRFRMKLELLDLKSKAFTQTANYLVTTTPAMTIARADN
jgi:hypothetical protein